MGAGGANIRTEGGAGQVTDQSVGDALQAARIAQETWARLPIDRRLAVIRRARHLMAAHPQRLMHALAPDGGRALEGIAAELLPLADACRFLERNAERLLAPQRLGRRGRPGWLAGVDAEVRREPLGVVLVIAPNNYPLLLPGIPALQALAAGNAVLVKPAPGCSWPVAVMGEMLDQAGLPAALFQVLGEDAAAARAAIDGGVDHVVLTGSASTGRRVLAALAPRLTPATLELSGNDAVFVLPGADLDMVADALAFGLRFNASATCIAPRRVFVTADDAAGLESKLAARLDAAPSLPIRATARAQIARLVEEASAAGARFLPERPRIDPAEIEALWLRPTAVLDADPQWALLREDVFAPLLAVVRVDNMDQALALARACPYALSASIFGAEAAALRLAGCVRAGSVVINDLIVPTADPRLAFGGRGESGFGVTRGAEGLLGLSAVKTIALRHGRFRPHFAPGGRAQIRLALAYLRAAHAGGAIARAAALLGLISALFRAVR